MRRTAFSWLAPTFAILTIVGAAQAQTKIGYVNSQEILASAPGAKEAEAQYQKDMQGYQDQAQKLQDELQNMQKALQQQQLTLSPEAKKNREQQLRQKQQEYQQKMQDLQQQASQRQKELMQPIMDKVTGVIEQVRKEGHYDLILDRAAGSILSADSTLDLTQEVISRLKTAAPSASSGTGGN